MVESKKPQARFPRAIAFTRHMLEVGIPLASILQVSWVCRVGTKNMRCHAPPLIDPAGHVRRISSGMQVGAYEDYQCGVSPLS